MYRQLEERLRAMGIQAQVKEAAGAPAGEPSPVGGRRMRKNHFYEYAMEKGLERVVEPPGGAPESGPRVVRSSVFQLYEVAYGLKVAVRAFPYASAPIYINNNYSNNNTITTTTTTTTNNNNNNNSNDNIYYYSTRSPTARKWPCAPSPTPPRR